MLFNSISFAIFLPIVFLLYWFVTNNNLKFQNILLLVSSYFFYSCWDWRFLFLLIFSTLLDYYTGIRMSEAKSINNKKFWFWLSISVNTEFLNEFFQQYKDINNYNDKKSIRLQIEKVMPDWQYHASIARNTQIKASNLYSKENYWQLFPNCNN